jgi:alpha-glucosidase (family GH31 glycosyl hydrolase)
MLRFTALSLFIAGHADGTLRYNAHNLHGAAMAQQHYNAFVAATGKRPFIMNR